MSAMSPMLVVPTPSHFQPITARRTVWTARPSPSQTLYTDNHFCKNLFSVFQNNFLMSPHQQTQSGRKTTLKNHSQILNMRVLETCGSTLPQVACWSCVRWNAGGARRLILTEPHPEEERWRLRWATEIQLQQELCTPKTQDAARVQIASAVQARLLTTAQVRKGTPSLIDVKGLGRPKEFSCKKRISNSGRRRLRHSLLEWSRIPKWCWSGLLNWRKSRQNSLIVNSCRPRRTRSEEYKTWRCCSRCTQHSWLPQVMKRMTFSPTRGRIRWRHGGDRRSDMIRRQEGENETFYERSFVLNGALFWNSKRELNAGSLLCRSTRRCSRIRWTTRSSWLVWRHGYQRRLRNTWFSTPGASELSRMHVGKSWRTCKDNTSKDPFSRCEICKNLGYRLSWRWQDKVGLQHPEEKNFVLGIAYAWWNEVDV